MESIQLNNVTKSYREGNDYLHVLRNISITVNRGEFVAIIGPSGSGKSTFLSIAGALLQPTEGEVLINGKNIVGLNEKELSKIRLENIGFILQTSNLIPYLTVLDQLLVVKKMKDSITSEDKTYATELLTEIGLGEKLNKYPEQLSGGERQRVAVARAFMNDPSIILADEPTASLDSSRAFEIVELIANGVKSRNKAAIMVTHDERMLPYCDKVYEIKDGKLHFIKENTASIRG